MKIAIVAAGFTPAEADELRRSMATFKFQGLVNKFQEKLIGGMVARGYQRDFAERVFRQLEGFGSYGFPESHAASFALLVYVSSWIKCHYPDIFAAALLNSQPMGFYAPAQIVTCARQHGVVVRPVDVNKSNWDNSLEEQAGKYRALRLGLRQIKGLREDEMNLLVARRKDGYRDIAALAAAGTSQGALERLAGADAFRSLGLDRRQALWECTAIVDSVATIFSSEPNEAIEEPKVTLPVMSLPQHVVADYASTALSLKAHPVSFVRDKLDALKITGAADLAKARNGQKIMVAGLVLVRQRPGTAGGVCFMTIEDETGVSNLVVFKQPFSKYRREILHSRLIMAEGNLQKEGEVIHVIVKKCYDLSHYLRDLTEEKREDLPLLTLARPDERGPQVSDMPPGFVPAARKFR